MDPVPTPPYTLVISTSLDVASKSRGLAVEVQTELERLGETTQLLDLNKIDLPAFDNGTVFDSESFARTHLLICEAESVVLAVPIYNWSVGSSAKNLIEATGATGEDGRKAAWFDKLVTFVCAGGLPHSYMAYSTLATSMMLDFKCVVNPYVVYATDRDWDEPGQLRPLLRSRLQKTVAVHSELNNRLRSRTYSSDWEI